MKFELYSLEYYIVGPTCKRIKVTQYSEDTDYSDDFPEDSCSL
jgi:hypothetical protein